MPKNFEHQQCLEHEAKIRASYEEEIKYLYGIIEGLQDQQKSQASLNDKLAESTRQLKKSERLYDEKEKYILFCTSQLEEREEDIGKLKERIHYLSIDNMSRSGSRSSSRTRSRLDLISLETLSNSLLVEEIITSMEELYNYALGTERLPNVETARHLKERITKASELFLDRMVDEETAERALKEIEEKYDEMRAESLQEVEKLREDIFHLGESLEGALVEMRDKDLAILDLETNLGRSQREYDELEAHMENLINQSERLEANHDLLVGELQRHLGNFRETERADQHHIRRLKRRIFILKIANRQLQIELMNAPLVAPPPIPPPQPIDQIWLLLH